MNCIGGLPGTADVRQGLIVGFARPLWLWAAPLTELPPSQIVASIPLGVLRSGCTWWCSARWWTDRVEIHPVFSSLMMAVKVAADQSLFWGPLERSVRELCCRACVCGSGLVMIREFGVPPEGCAEEGSGLGRHPTKRNMPCVSPPDSTC